MVCKCQTLAEPRGGVPDAMADLDDFAEPSPYEWSIRDWVKIIDNILKICKTGALRTHIMYKCNLNTIQTRKYLDLLETQGLIELMGEEVQRGSIYKTTERGMDYLSAFKRLEETLH